MTCSLGSSRFESESDYYWVDVNLPAESISRAEFKFAINTGEQWQWEDGSNRLLSEMVNGHDGPGLVLLPVERFRAGSGSENDLTGRFYQTVKDRKEISIRPVSENIVLGSCPRRKEHVDRLKQMGVSVVLNFQTEEDCQKNCILGIGMEENALAVSKLYEAVGIQYVWLPTWDMSTAGRRAMLPHASFLLAGLVKRGHKVYVHCNAGVGRSVGAVCGFLRYCVGLTDRQLQHVVARARTVAYFDFTALEDARPNFEVMFGGPDESFAPLKRSLLEAAKIVSPDEPEPS